MDQLGGEQLDAGDLAVDAGNFDVFADAKWLGEDDGQTGHDVAEHALHRQPNADATYANTGNQRRDLDANLVEHHHKNQPHDRQADQTHEEQADRRFDMMFAQPFVEPPADDAREEQTG